MTTNQKIKDLILSNLDTILDTNHKNLPTAKKPHINETIIVFDGVVNENKFHSNGILFLLKEAVEKSIEDNHKDKIINIDKDIRSFDLIRTAYEEAKQQSSETYTGELHWKELCEWVYAFKHPDHSFLNVINHGRYLNEISIVNIKKVAGQSTTDMKIMNTIVNNDKYKNLLKEEINLLLPRIVICCGTFEQAKILYGVNETTLKLNSGVDYFKHQNILFVNFIHPTQYGAAQKPSMKYAYAKEVFGELSRRINLL